MEANLRMYKVMAAYLGDVIKQGIAAGWRPISLAALDDDPALGEVYQLTLMRPVLPVQTDAVSRDLPEPAFKPKHAHEIPFRQAA